MQRASNTSEVRKTIGTLKISYQSVNGESTFGVFGCFPSKEEKRGKILGEMENNFAGEEISENIFF